MVDRRIWGAGEWDYEPDEATWTDKDTGFPCRAVRNQLGAWCGYVGIFPGHPLHGLDYDEVEDAVAHVRVHGGLTYAGGDLPFLSASLGEDRRASWLGFACDHTRDIVPGLSHPLFQPIGWQGTYKNLPYVQQQCAELARQLRAIQDAVKDISADALALASRGS